MEEQKSPVEEPKTQFLPQEESPVDAIFDEFRELDFGDGSASTAESEDPKTKRLQMFVKVSDILFKVTLVAVLVFGLDASLRNMQTAGVLADAGLCSYLGMGVTSDNADCQAYSERIATAETQEKTLKSDLVAILDTFVERKIQMLGIANSPEVQFIQRKTSADRVSLTKISDEFNRIKDSATRFHGLDIDCSKMEMKENGSVNVSCDFYGNAISGGSGESTTSRATALAFIEKISAPGSAFRLLDSPEKLSIERYMSSDPGTKGTFTTKTTLSLRLRYINSNQP